MDEQALFRYGTDVTYLASCALHAKAPDRERVAQMDLAAVCKVARHHSMDAITYLAVADCVAANGEAFLGEKVRILDDWNQLYSREIGKIVRFDIEREALTSFLEQQGIWYLPLKGLILQNHYPKLGMRQMCDNDILIDPKGREKVREYMEARGYTVKCYGNAQPDTYIKAPCYNFEIHHILFEDSERDRLLSEYYDGIRGRLVPDGESGLRYRMTDEDFYVYQIAHCHKHFIHGGTGVRSLMDIIVFRRARTLDEPLVRGELEKLGLLAFEESARALAESVFAEDGDGGASLEGAEKDALMFHISSGTYGNMNNFVAATLERLSDGEPVTRMTKLRYCMRRLFPPMEFYRLHHPTVYRYKILIPGFWLIRLFRKAIFRPSNVRNELEVLKKSKDAAEK